MVDLGSSVKSQGAAGRDGGCVSRHQTVLSRACIRAAPGLDGCARHWHGDLKVPRCCALSQPIGLVANHATPDLGCRGGLGKETWRRCHSLVWDLTCITPANTWPSILKKEQEQAGKMLPRRLYLSYIFRHRQTFFLLSLMGLGCF